MIIRFNWFVFSAVEISNWPGELKPEMLTAEAVNTYIEEYAFGNQFNHKARSERKLLLNKRELKGLFRSVQAKGLTIVPLKLFTNEKGMAKLEIGLCKGKKTYDKRESLKEQDTKRDLDRIKNHFK